MSKYAINPNAPPDLHAEEMAALDRDRAALLHLDIDGAGRSARAADAAPLPPRMILPDPRYPHGDIDAVEARLADLKKVRAAEAPPPADAADECVEAPTGNRALSHPLVVSLLAALPEPRAEWSAEGRADWLRATESIFRLIYRTEGRIAIAPRRG